MILKSTGVVRRIDDLGRIVIPKEIRRTLRIREGDPLEIFTDNSGNIIFKKYSVIKELSPFALRYADVLFGKIKMPVIISDCDHVIAVSGAAKREFIERRITSYLEEMMKSRTSFSAYKNPNKKFLPIEGLDNEAFCAYPIISSGDVSGSICALKNDKLNMPENEKIAKISLVEITSQFLGKHLED